MRVIATAGHVDHGKSTLVRALTGTDPDRWAEEHRRGLTIDLGYAWTRLPGGETLAFVDVPGHQRFIGNMLAGLGPAPAVLFVVAADEGWRAQSTDHLAAVRALGIEHAVVALTRADLADPGPAAADVRARLAGTPLANAEIVPCSAITGAGLDNLRAALARLCATLPAPAADGRVRLWVDRAFTVRGSGTVVTGTLASGRLRTGDALALHGAGGERRVVVRGLQALGEPAADVAAVARVAVNLRGVAVEQVGRGDALLTPDAWHLTDAVDARLDHDPADLPEHVLAHVGTHAAQVRVRPLGPDTARLAWPHPLPLTVGDRVVLRDTGRRAVGGGALVLDADPPALTRRGAGRRRGAELASGDARFDVAAETARRGWATAQILTSLGATPADLDAAVDAGAVRRAPGGLLVAPDQWERWATDLRRVVEDAVAADPLQARLPAPAAASAVALPATGLVAGLAPDAGLELVDGHLEVPGRAPDLGAAEPGLRAVEAQLAAEPFAAPERDDLAARGLGPRQLAAAVRLGRLVDLGESVVLAPKGPALAMRTLASLPQPFTTSEARRALGTTRRVAIPLLEELDRRGWTRRLDAGHREVVRTRPATDANATKEHP